MTPTVGSRSHAPIAHNNCSAETDLVRENQFEERLEKSKCVMSSKCILFTVTDWLNVPHALLCPLNTQIFTFRTKFKAGTQLDIFVLLLRILYFLRLEKGKLFCLIL